jgi:hypothetical protein
MHAGAYEASAEFRELRAQLQRSVRMRYFYQRASGQLPGHNPKDTWVPAVVDGKTPPFDPFEAPVPGPDVHVVRTPYPVA